MQKKLNIQVEGTYENSYSLSMVNKQIALALQNHVECEVKVYATTYHEEYMYSLTNIDPNIKPLVEKDLENIDISIRNIYPPFATNMKGYHKIIGPYGWEESKFPTEYVEWFNTKLTMVFAMSEYVKNLLKENGVKIPIVTTGIIVEDILKVDSHPFDFDLPAGFKLLHVSSGFARKGVDILLEAFEATKDTSLMIKTFSNPHNNTKTQLKKLNYKVQTTYEEDINLYVKKDKKILLINKEIPQSKLKYLYEHSNILVAPSFGEGFGLPLAEAMLLDLPVITTGFSGQSDFCTDETAWLIDYDLKPAKTHLNLKNSLWAVPKVASLNKQILEIKSSSKKEITKKTKLAKEYILSNYSSKKIAKKIFNAII